MAGSSKAAQSPEPETIETVRHERDEALRALATERARIQAHLLHCPELKAVSDASPEAEMEPPLRYRVVDAANGSFKQYLGWIHSSVRTVAMQLDRVLRPAPGRNSREP